ncbi:hypothetical protein SynPROS91_01194 [Synechococcus sp. PROS-9-1]|nr:hypothetical protein SynPROS91_01194 [Synechococcus sp. PROS-9-1]
MRHDVSDQTNWRTLKTSSQGQYMGENRDRLNAMDRLVKDR